MQCPAGGTAGHSQASYVFLFSSLVFRTSLFHGGILKINILTCLSTHHVSLGLLRKKQVLNGTLTGYIMSVDGKIFVCRNILKD